MTTVTISGLTKRFGTATAVDDLSIEIGQGELVSLLGPSGCGKTTTLRSIAGFVEPDAGQILFDGVDITSLPPERRNIGMVFQNYALFPHMTVRQNLRFGLEMRRVARNEMAERIDAVLDIVQLAGLEDRYPRELSGGQQQRVALARGLVIEPAVLLLDEPLANLDAKLREEMRFFIRSLQKRVGITTVYVTHDQAEAMVISDRIVVMFDGRIRQIGDATDIYAHPVSRDVADFIGLSNFIDGRVKARREADYYLVETPLGEIRCRSALTLAVGDAAMVMVRPESVRLSREPPDNPGLNGITGRVRDRFYLGNIAGYRIACNDGSVMQVQEEPWHAGAVGDTVWCLFASELAWIIRR
ncbi:MAG TPA: ABC transporter ATP-binding protein [Stellaceae bacterium]|jgi:putative spermidine/putrescine transport system ATP-binding protein|nr:ABC transporter ATP-binding protein [Stellaceae bacterium]